MFSLFVQLLNISDIITPRNILYTKVTSKTERKNGIFGKKDL